MGRKRRTAEEIIGHLREVEVRLAKGETIGIACRAIGVTEQTYYRWRREYGGLKVDQAKRLKELESVAVKRMIRGIICRRNEPTPTEGCIGSHARQAHPF